MHVWLCVTLKMFRARVVFLHKFGVLCVLSDELSSKNDEEQVRALPARTLRCNGDLQ